MDSLPEIFENVQKGYYEVDSYEGSTSDSEYKKGSFKFNRDEKIRWYKEEKTLSAFLKDTQTFIKQDHVDEEKKELPQINMEIDFMNNSETYAEKIERIREENANKPKQDPLVITRDMVKSAVFGAGYPSLPKISLEEHVNNQINEGAWPTKPNMSTTDIEPRGVRRIDPSDDQREKDEENKRKDDEAEDGHDEEKLASERKMDTYKDDHRRGEGNRMYRL